MINDNSISNNYGASNITEPPKVVSDKHIKKNFTFVITEFACEVKKIEYWKEINFYKVKEKNFAVVKKRQEFIMQVNNYIHMKNWPSLLNLILQKSYKVAMDITPKDFKYINFMINDKMLIRIEVEYNNKKEAKKLGSLIILRLLAKIVYNKCEKGEGFNADEFSSQEEEDE